MSARVVGRFASGLCAAALLGSCGDPTPSPRPPVGAVLPVPPATPSLTSHYLFFLHGQIVEGQGDGAVHPRFGPYRYCEVVNALATRGLTVISEVRPAGTEVERYADTVVGQIRRLLAAGVAPQRITIAGHSKGGAIAAVACSRLAEPRLRVVLLAACGPWLEQPQAPRLAGRVLAIRDRSDDLAGSCRGAFARAVAGSTGRELELDLGEGHGLFFRPRPEWVDPLVEWATAD